MDLKEYQRKQLAQSYSRDSIDIEEKLMVS